MQNIVVKYQRAFNKIVDKLKANESVLAVMVFGSMVSGDLWDESDIDLFVITKDESSVIKNIYTEEKDVQVHIKIMNKEKFLQMGENDLRGGFIHRIFASSKLVFSRDSEITNRYNNGRYYPDLDRERWNLVYLGRLLKDLSQCKKYLRSGRFMTAYSLSIQCIEEFSRLYVNYSGHMISKDAMSLAVSLNNQFRSCVEELFGRKDSMEVVIGNTIEFISGEIDSCLKNMAALLIEHIKKSETLLSAEDIKNSSLFESCDIEIEEILSELWRRNIIKKTVRDYNLSDGTVIIQENVYYL